MKSADEIVKAVASKALSVTEVANETLDLVDRHDRAIHAFIAVDGARVLAEAAALDRAARRTGPLPLFGAPFAVKDVIDVAGYPTRLGSAAFESAPPALKDAAVVARVRRAGALFIGKTTTHELALGVVTPGTANPYDERRVVGGSSGGSSAAVAAGIVPIGLGTDTGGSLRIPAALCGTVGLKPTGGRVPVGGVRPNSWTLDSVGAITRTATDARTALGVMQRRYVDAAGLRPRVRISVGTLRLARIPDPFETRISADVAAGLETASEVLGAITASMVDAELPSASLYGDVQQHIQTAEISAYHATTLGRARDSLSREVREVLELGQLILASDYLRSLQLRERIRREWTALFRRVDVVLAPVTACLAVVHGTPNVSWPDGQIEPLWSAYSRLTAPANLAGLPAISIPVGLSRDGLPLAIQLIGRPERESILLELADQLMHSVPTPPPSLNP